MSKPLVSPALAQFVAATTGRNMTKAAYVAVATGVVMMVLLTVDPAYEAAHHWVDAVLWACLAFFVFEWVVRLRHAFLAQRGWAYVLSGRGLVDAVAAAGDAARAHLLGANPKTGWLLGVFWMLKVVPGIPGLRQLRRVLVLESGPLLSVLVIFLMVLFLASVAVLFSGARRPAGRLRQRAGGLVVGGRDPDHDRIWRRGADHAARPAGRGLRDDLRPRRVRALDRYPRHRLCRRNPPRQFPEDLGIGQQGAVLRSARSRGDRRRHPHAAHHGPAGAHHDHPQGPDRRLHVFHRRRRGRGRSAGQEGDARRRRVLRRNGAARQQSALRQYHHHAGVEAAGARSRRLPHADGAASRSRRDHRRRGQAARAGKQYNGAIHVRAAAASGEHAACSRSMARAPPSASTGRSI